MSGFDKFWIREDLLKLGWISIEDTGLMVPPQSLWDNKPDAFDVYKAREIQDLLGEQTPEEGE